jgi:glycosyltransferase involved in cell wall biosynthesis
MAQALAQRGHQVIIACYNHGEGPDPDGVTVIRAPKVPGAQLSRSGPHWSKPIQNVLLARTVRKIVREYKPDIIHAHNVEAPLVARLSSLRMGGVPVVYNSHTRMADELSSYGPDWLRGPVGLLGRAIDGAMPLVSHAALAISDQGAQHLGGRWGGEVAMIPPGVDLAEFEEADAARAREAWDLDQRPWVVYAGNADAYQELPILFSAVGRLKKLGLLVVTGADLDPLRRLAVQHGVEQERLRLVHSTRFRDTLDALAVGSVSGLPRTKCAGFPIKLLNQLALGLPTVAAEGCAAPIPGVLSVPNGDAVAMAAALQRIACDPSLRTELSKKAKAAITADWTWERRAMQLEVFYEQLLVN